MSEEKVGYSLRGNIVGEGEGPVVHIVTGEEKYGLFLDGEKIIEMGTDTIEDDCSYSLDLVRKVLEKLGVRYQWGDYPYERYR